MGNFSSKVEALDDFRDVRAEAAEVFLEVGE